MTYKDVFIGLGGRDLCIWWGSVAGRLASMPHAAGANFKILFVFSSVYAC